MIDIGLLVTGAAVAIAFLWGRGKWLRHVLLFSWAAVALASVSGASMSVIVLLMTLMDLMIAGTALSIVTHDPKRNDARVVGAISMALMPAHWVVAMAQGEVSWTLYAGAVNAAFVIQCLIVRGWLDGLGRSAARIVSRLRPFHIFGRRG